MSKSQACCSLLSVQENVVLSELIERKNQSLASGVVQVFLALPAHSHMWTKECSGVACFIKDNPRRSYYIRVYNLKKGTLVWEQELYNQIEYRMPHPHFHTFAADDCEAGLNFANEQEAQKFNLIIQEKLNHRQSRQEKRHHGPPPPSQPPESKRPSISAHVPIVDRGSSELPNSGPVQMPTLPINNPDITGFRYRGLGPVVSAPAPDRKKQKGKAKKKMTKADIGAPSNFQHVSHVGWDPNKGFNVNEMDPDLKNLFHKAGISEAQMTDAETSRVLYDFIEHQGGLEVLKEQMRQQELAPDPPTRSSHPPPVPPPPSVSPSSRGRLGPLPPVPSVTPSPTPPPPPPSLPRGPLPPPPPRGGGGQRGPPPPPVPRPPEHPSPVAAPMGAPAPPPPPPLSMAPSGGGGKRPEPTAAASPGRGALLDQIRIGRALKPVSSIPDDSQPPEEDSEGLVGALMMVMKQRSKVIHSSDEGEEEGVEDEFDDEWDD